MEATNRNDRRGRERSRGQGRDRGRGRGREPPQANQIQSDPFQEIPVHMLNMNMLRGLSRGGLINCQFNLNPAFGMLRHNVFQNARNGCQNESQSSGHDPRAAEEGSSAYERLYHWTQPHEEPASCSVRCGSACCTPQPAVSENQGYVPFDYNNLSNTSPLSFTDVRNPYTHLYRITEHGVSYSYGQMVPYYYSPYYQCYFPYLDYEYTNPRSTAQSTHRYSSPVYSKCEIEQMCRTTGKFNCDYIKELLLYLHKHNLVTMASHTQMYDRLTQFNLGHANVFAPQENLNGCESSRMSSSPEIDIVTISPRKYSPAKPLFEGTESATTLNLNTERLVSSENINASSSHNLSNNLQNNLQISESQDMDWILDKKTGFLIKYQTSQIKETDCILDEKSGFLYRRTAFLEREKREKLEEKTAQANKTSVAGISYSTGTISSKENNIGLEGFLNISPITNFTGFLNTNKTSVPRILNSSIIVPPKKINVDLEGTRTSTGIIPSKKPNIGLTRSLFNANKTSFSRILPKETNVDLERSLNENKTSVSQISNCTGAVSKKKANTSPARSVNAKNISVLKNSNSNSTGTIPSNKTNTGLGRSLKANKKSLNVNKTSVPRKIHSVGTSVSKETNIGLAGHLNTSNSINNSEITENPENLNGKNLSLKQQLLNRYMNDSKKEASDSNESKPYNEPKNVENFHCAIKPYAGSISEADLKKTIEKKSSESKKNEAEKQQMNAGNIEFFKHISATMKQNLFTDDKDKFVYFSNLQGKSCFIAEHPKNTNNVSSEQTSTNNDSIQTDEEYRYAINNPIMQVEKCSPKIKGQLLTLEEFSKLHADHCLYTNTKSNCTAYDLPPACSFFGVRDTRSIFIRTQMDTRQAEDSEESTTVNKTPRPTPNVSDNMQNSTTQSEQVSSTQMNSTFVTNRTFIVRRGPPYDDVPGIEMVNDFETLTMLFPRIWPWSIHGIMILAGNDLSEALDMLIYVERLRQQRENNPNAFLMGMEPENSIQTTFNEIINENNFVEQNHTITSSFNEQSSLHKSDGESENLQSIIVNDPFATDVNQSVNRKRTLEPDQNIQTEENYPTPLCSYTHESLNKKLENILGSSISTINTEIEDEKPVDDETPIKKKKKKKSKDKDVKKKHSHSVKKSTEEYYTVDNNEELENTYNPDPGCSWMTLPGTVQNTKRKPTSIYQSQKIVSSSEQIATLRLIRVPNPDFYTNKYTDM